MLKKFLLLSMVVSFANFANAQILTTLPDGGNKRSSVTEWIGITEVEIDYNRPAVKGREGKIWGKLVHYGFADEGFGTSKSSPWRAGANENTTIKFSTDVMIEGKPVPAGKYGFFVALEEQSATIILSKNNNSWGSYFYDPKEDVVRVQVKPVTKNESLERLRFDFSEQKENSALISLSWEKLSIPFTVSVDYVKTQLESFRNELRTEKGFNKDAWVQAANFCVTRDVNLDEALRWSDYAINGVFVGQKTFTTLMAKASVLEKLKRNAEADSLKKQAVPLGDMNELHAYGRMLLTNKKAAEALEIFKLNSKNNPNVYTTDMGLARGYSANGDFKNSLKYLKLALVHAPDKGSKDAIEQYIITAGANKDINLQ